MDFSKTFDAADEFISKIQEASDTLKKNLIKAVQDMHPEHVFTIPEEQSKQCNDFLNDYLNDQGKIFSSNYDLLLYWVLMRNHCSQAVDGFGRDIENGTDAFVPEDALEYSELRWGKYRDTQNIFYLHGALLLFDDGINIIKEEYDGNFLLEKIKKRMENKEYPIFVTAGTACDKLKIITHNRYLMFCYDELCRIGGSLITYGFRFGENDSHIIDAINQAAKLDLSRRLYSVYVGVYSDEDLSHIKGMEKSFNIKVNVYNAQTVNVWK